jgi:hypothetical protein
MRGLFVFKIDDSYVAIPKDVTIWDDDLRKGISVPMIHKLNLGRKIAKALKDAPTASRNRGDETDTGKKP